MTNPQPGEQLAAEASGFLACLAFGVRLGELIGEVVVDAALPVRDAGGDAQALVLDPLAAGLRSVADWLQAGTP